VVFKTSKIDTVLINPLLNIISIIVVIFSKLTDLFDKLIVDGLVSIVRKVMQIFGLIFTKLHSERVQLHFVSAIIGLVIILVWLKFAI